MNKYQITEYEYGHYRYVTIYEVEAESEEEAWSKYDYGDSKLIDAQSDYTYVDEDTEIKKL